MRTHAKEPKLLGASWVPPLVGFAGTAAAMLIAFARIGTEPQWETTLVSVGFSILVVGTTLIALQLVAWSRRR